MPALVGGCHFEHNPYDRALQGRRSGGTAITPFVFAAAFEKGMFPGSVVEDSALDNRAVMIGGTTGILGEWGPENPENRYEGPITAREALSKSKNGATVRLGMNPGVDNVVELCHNAGMKSPLRPYPATFLGSSEVTLAELAMAYTVFPDGGWRASTPHILERIEEKDGTVVWDGKQQSIRKIVIKPETAYEVHSCLVDALQSGTGKAAYTQFGLKKFPAAGKTGTAYDFTDALFAGYDSNFTCAVWTGFDKPQKIYRGAFAREFSSSDLPHAELAVNLSEVMPVAIKSPTLVVDNDPYNSIKPTLVPEPTPQPGTQTAETEKSPTGAGTNELKPTSKIASQNP